MSTPTGPLSFSQIQSEFGGASPISLSEYYRGGAYVPSNQVTSATDGTAVSTSGAIRVGMFRGLTKIVGGIVSPLTNRSTVYGAISSSAQSVWANFYTDGTNEGFRHGNVSEWAGNWYTPTTAGIGSGYWIRATLSSGQTPSSGSALDTWLQLNATRTWTYTAPSGGMFSSRSGTLLIQISSNSTGTNIVTSGSFYFEVSREV